MSPGEWAIWLHFTFIAIGGLAFIGDAMKKHTAAVVAAILEAKR